ncbi:MAG TPA: CAP domain-containing protein [Candidatus Limnocylindria bacterium]|nr:CAP domain-containing protein [Candidatus Limnocylindria bacterium]
MLLPTIGSQPARMNRVVALLLALTLAGGTLATFAAPALAFGGDGLRAAANGYRTEHGLAPVIGTALLDDIASKRAARLANRDKLEHDIDYVSERLNRAGVCWQGFGEIIAWESGYPTYSYDRTMLAWWKSKPHHDIVMTPEFNAAGGAWRRADDGDPYSVMVFVDLCDSSATTVKEPRPGLDSRYDPARPLVFWRGRHVGYKLSASGEILGRTAHTYGSRTVKTSVGRSVIDGKRWLKVSSGPLRGYWVPERAGSFVRGMTKFWGFEAERRATLASGTIEGWKFTWWGRVDDHKKHTFSKPVRVDASARAIINGRLYLRVASGYLSGFWVLDKTVVELK